MSGLFWVGRGFHFDLAAAGLAGKALRASALGGRRDIIHIFNIRLAVHGEIGEAIGEGIVMSEIVGEVDGFKILDEGLRLIEQRLERRVFDAVFAEHLLDDEFTVAADLKLAAPELGGFAKADDQGHVFSDVVGGAADVFADGDEGRGVLGGENDADAGRSGIAAAAAVEVERDRFLHCVPAF